MKRRTCLPLLMLPLFFGLITDALAQNTSLWSSGVSLIPYPQKVQLKGDRYIMQDSAIIFIDKNASVEDLFTANELASRLEDLFHIRSTVSSETPEAGIILSRLEAGSGMKEQAYRLKVTRDHIRIVAGDAAGLFYGMQTLLQIIQKKGDVLIAEGMEIEDWPLIVQRAVHYDSKHFQEHLDYVKGFIRTLASYKINMLIWEWEDKFAYPSHPEIGAPGAFTMEEMQELTRYARKYHVQIVPLVQGLGHVSYLLKWPQFRKLREIESSNWEICPLHEGSYELLFDLWEDALEASPGSDYIHIGSDETWELGSCEQCKAKAEEIGISGLYHLFIHRAGKHLQEKGRKVMCWERPMGWEIGKSPAIDVEPLKDLVLTESYAYETPGFTYAKQASEQGHELFLYDPNPGIEHLFLPYFYRENGAGEESLSHIERSYQSITKQASSGYFHGMVSTSWNCSGVHNQIWMLRYLTAAEYSWSPDSPGLPEFSDKFFVNYYGSGSHQVKELFYLLNRASYFYMNAFERKVWHWGEVGKTHLPDLPRDDIEYDSFWSTEYKEMIKQSAEQEKYMRQALEICNRNLELDVKNTYDFELFRGLAGLFLHTANTYLSLSALEAKIGEAHQLHFMDHGKALQSLEEASQIVVENLQEREHVFQEIKSTWEKHQFPKGMSVPGKDYLHARDRQRNFANRRPDLSFMIYDEELLQLEAYLEGLENYISWYRSTFISP